MAASTDVVILGAGFRGLWLASELVKLGWSVTWYQVHKFPKVNQQGDFIFDDWPLQVGPRIESSFLHVMEDFVKEVIKPVQQDMAVQIVTPHGAIELSGDQNDRCLKKFFPNHWQRLKNYFECISKSQRVEKGRKLLTVQTKDMWRRPLGQRWPLEWLGCLRRSRSVDTLAWVTQWDGELLDPRSKLWLLSDSLEFAVERALRWGEKKGVKLGRDVVVSDIGIEGSLATGIEVVGGGGFLKCKRIILACSHETATKAVPRLSKTLKPYVRAGSEIFVWARCGFFLKAQTKPSGLCPFSSFVIDPYMPLVGSNMGFLKWNVAEKGDSLTVWTKIPFGEMKRRSYLVNLTEEVERNLSYLFPWFSKRLVSVFPYDDYFNSQEKGHDDLPIIFDEKNKFKNPSSKLRNVMVMGPGADRGLELLSQLAAEYRVLQQLTEVRKKELKRDRALHPPRNGQDLVQPN